MGRRLVLLALLLAAVPVLTQPTSTGAGAQAKAPGPLRVMRANPRYFSDGRGRAVYLTGSHVWWNLLGDRTWTADCYAERRYPFDYGGYLRRLQRYRHNFFRLWTFEITRWRECGGDTISVSPQPWARSGPGTALDGLGKFDLSRFNPAYFARLRNRVARAQARGIYVSIMLFEGWSLRFAERPWRWAAHPFNAANNVNGVNGDRNNDDVGTEVHTLANPRVLAIQKAYVRRVIDTVNGLDNVLYEISNESGHESTAWQYHMIRFIKRYQARKRQQHPVGMTYQNPGGRNDTLLSSPADWISPAGGEPWLRDPPAAAPRVQLSDTDHHCGLCGDASFAWTSLTRGYNPIFMDPLDSDRTREAVRRSLGNARGYARRMNLATSRPLPDLSSTRFCLATPGREYLVYQPARGPFWVDIGSAARSFRAEWFDPASGRRIIARVSGRGRVHVTPPFSGPAVLYLRR